MVNAGIKENVIDPYKKDNDVSLYLTTYANDTIDELTSFYETKHLNLLDPNKSNQRTTMLTALEMIRNEPLDFIIVSRFDIRWYQKIADLNVDYNKFNFLYKEVEPEWSNNRFVSDIIFLFPRFFL